MSTQASHSLTRRALVSGLAATSLLPRSGRAQTRFYGRIAFVQDGNIMQWTPTGVTELKRDGHAMSPSWQPGADMLMYVRDGGSYSNLIALNTTDGRTRRLTDSESSYQPGSQDYVYDCDWINDAYWSESDTIVFSSNAAPSDGSLNLWVLDYANDHMFLAATDYAEPGHIEKATVDATGTLAAYTVTGDDLRSSRIGLRDLETGVTTTVMGPNAYDGAISPNGRWIVASMRGENNINDLWLWSRESGQLTQLTEGEEASNPVWDPFGEAIAYLAYVDDGFSLRAFYLNFSGDRPHIDGEPTVLIPKANIDASSRPSWNTDK